MDTITHGLPGALVVRSVLPAKHPGHPFSNRHGCWRAPWPGLSLISFTLPAGSPHGLRTLWHCGITHSFVLLPLRVLFVGVCRPWFSGNSASGAT